MPKTRSDLIGKALSILEEAGAGQTLSDEDKELVGATYDVLREELSADGVVEIGNAEAIPEYIFLPLARMLANEVGDDFGRPYSEDVRLIQERRIRRALAITDYSTPLATDYF